MDLSRRSQFVYGLIAAIWVLVLAWQIEEHARVREAAQSDLHNRADDIANTVGAIIRGMRFGGIISQSQIEPVLNEMVNGRTNEAFQSKTRELISVALLNTANEEVAAVGRPIDPRREDLLAEGEHWGQTTVTLVSRPVDLGASFIRETVILPPQGGTEPSRPPRRDPASDFGSSNSPASSMASNAPSVARPDPSPPPPRGRRFRPYPFAGISDAQYQAMLEKRTWHALALTLSTEALESTCTRDLWLRTVIMLLATLSAVGSGLAFGNLAKSSDLQIRLVRASELTSHLKEMNVAAAGLAHETRNPLNIIRGLAQMISKQPDSTPPVRQKAREIVDQADRVAAQLNEFINYSRPREVRRSPVALGAVFNEVARALNYDLEEKKIRLHIKGEQIVIEADEQMLRQVLFNLVLNAVQAVNGSGEIQVVSHKVDNSEALIEVRDNGPGVPVENRSEIFKPYFTTQKTGTGLGLAVVQQIVLAHGWEIECLPNTPTGAIFRLSHLKLANS